jgi:hypothetical protein
LLLLSLLLSPSLSPSLSHTLSLCLTPTAAAAAAAAAAEECDHIISMADPLLQRSGVVNTESGGSDISDIRTSSGVFLERGQDDVVKGGQEVEVEGLEIRVHVAAATSVTYAPAAARLKTKVSNRTKQLVYTESMWG